MDAVDTTGADCGGAEDTDRINRKDAGELRVSARSKRGRAELPRRGGTRWHDSVGRSIKRSAAAFFLLV